jgi:sugar (pentulose or hexulose) kinase
LYANKRVLVGAAIIVVSVVIGTGFAGWGAGLFSPDAHAAPGTPCALSYIDQRDSDLCADASGTVSLHNLHRQRDTAGRERRRGRRPGAV